MAAIEIDRVGLLAAATALANAQNAIAELNIQLRNIEGLEQEDRWLLDGFTEDALLDGRLITEGVLNIREAVLGGLMPDEARLREAVGPANLEPRYAC